MPKVVRDGACIWWDCPGCGDMHSIPVALTGGNASKNWHFNGDIEKPTVSPSVLTRSRFTGQTPKMICHFFIREGRAEFCTDSTHQFAGKTVELPERSIG